MAKWHPAGILAAAFSVFSSAPALAQQVTPPPVIMQRPPVSPGVVAAMAPQPGAAFSAVCVDVTRFEAEFYITFICKTASGQSITVRNWDMVDSKTDATAVSDAQMDDFRATQARKVQLLSQAVLSFMTIKALNPASTVKLSITGSNSHSKSSAGEPRVTKAVLIR